MKLSRDFYLQSNTVDIAKALLGKLLVVPTESGERISGIIVETEAYLGVEDKAAHSYGGRRTARNEVTYAEGGRAYVFFVYGMHHQLNVVTGEAGRPQVCLVRAVEPFEGVDTMRARRGREIERELTSGPGKLCAALGIDRNFNGEDLLGERIWIEYRPDVEKGEIAVGKRVGIDYAEEDADAPLRFWIRGNRFVSKK